MFAFQNLCRSTSRAELTGAGFRANSRLITSTVIHLNASPEWQTLIGGREQIAKKRQMFETKYAAVLKEKAKKEGVSVEELKRRKLAQNAAGSQDRVEKTQKVSPSPGPVEAGSLETRKADEPAVVNISRPLPSSSKSSAPSSPQGPVKPLNDIMDLSKAVNLASSAVSQLWTTYHQQKGFLSAAVPTDKYEMILERARKYPMFILPLVRDSTVVPGDDNKAAKGAVEIHVLQWAVLPAPETAVERVPNPSTVLFTPLAEYKARQDYAQPYLILTHYTDLAKSHNIVLMRGEITDNVSLNDTDAQILAVRLQLFYLSTGSGGANEKTRQQLLASFHERPDEFDLDALIKTAGQL